MKKLILLIFILFNSPLSFCGDITAGGGGGRDMVMDPGHSIIGDSILNIDGIEGGGGRAEYSFLEALNAARTGDSINGGGRSWDKHASNLGFTVADGGGGRESFLNVLNAARTGDTISEGGGGWDKHASNLGVSVADGGGGRDSFLNILNAARTGDIIADGGGGRDKMDTQDIVTFWKKNLSENGISGGIIGTLP